MGIPVLILGESGSGKSASLRNFSPEEVGVFNVAGKPLPFRRKLPTVNNATYNSIYRGLGIDPTGKKPPAPKLKRYVIDDSQYLMAFEFLYRSRETGYQKYTELALNFSGLVRTCINALPDDCIVYFLHHTELTDGRTKAKTVGKMLDEKITLEGLFSIVLLCEASKEGHRFITQSDGYTTAKSPMEMFPETIDNDLKLVDTTIRDYYEFNKEDNAQ